MLVVSTVLSLVLRPGWAYVYLLSFMVGLTVRFTSIGARVIVSFTLLNLAKIDPKEVAGGTMAYDLALTGLSFANYAGVGIVDYNLAGALILGTVPGVYIETRANSRINKDVLKSNQHHDSGY
ncbi:sulfite exporter TauE/SafE family protein [Thermococcus bergensis]|uniref:sulfite exporter TauE/SafE family protein n=1 Tax=Thermococcus bergensis TaxID=2689387 RepID=UPI00298F38BF|nr:sulfite exporter TauE/SafE family protein [Thermococcus bergensis]